MTSRRLKPAATVTIALMFLVLLNPYSLILNPKIASGEDVKPPIIVDGDKVEYLDEEKKVVGTGNVVIRYGDTKLTAEKIVVDTESKKAEASGGVKLRQGDKVFSADRLTYDFEQNVGTLLEARVETDPWYGSCKEAEQVSADEVVLKGGYISTCDANPPHYRIRAKRITIYLDDKIAAKNVTLQAGPVPFFILPFYSHPMHDNEFEVSILPGHRKDWGAYVLSAWNYDVNDANKGKIHVDQREDKGFATGVTHQYTTEKFGKGLLHGYYMQERQRGKAEGEHAERQRYKAQLRHKWDMANDRRLLAEYHEFTDASFNKEFFYREEYEDEPEPKSYVYFLSPASFYNFEVLTQKRANRFLTQTDYLPEVAFDVRNVPLWTGVYYKGELRAGALQRKNASSDVDDDVLRFDTYDEISASFRATDVLRLRPYAGTRQTWYSKNGLAEEDALRGAFYTGIDLSSRFFKTFDVKSRFLNVPINDLRHIINPVLRYSYIHEPTISRSNLMEFDDIDTLERKNALSLTLENKLQTKTDSGSILNLGTLILGSEYLFKPEQGSELGNITADLEISPSENFILESDASFDPHSAKMRIANVDFIAKKDEDWSVGVGHRYQTDESNELTFENEYQLLPKVKTRVYERYQFRTEELKEQEYGLSFDLHCWLADVNYNISNGTTFWVTLRLKAFPDVPFELGTEYHKPKPTPPSR